MREKADVIAYALIGLMAILMAIAFAKDYPGAPTMSEEAGEEAADAESSQEASVVEDYDITEEPTPSEPQAGRVSLKDCFVVLNSYDSDHSDRMGWKKAVRDEKTLKGLMEDAHYFDYGEMALWNLGTYVGEFAVEMRYAEPIKFNGTAATLYSPEIRLGERLSDDREHIQRDTECREFIDLLTIVQGETLQTKIIVRRGDAYYRYDGEAEDFAARNLVLACMDNESEYGRGAAYPFAMERGAFKTLMKIVKKGAYREDCPFEAIGVEYETLDGYSLN